MTARLSLKDTRENGGRKGETMLSRIKNIILNKLSSPILVICSRFGDLCFLKTILFSPNYIGKYFPFIDSAELKINRND